MSLWAIVPVKPLRRGKSRLSGVLTEEERTLLNYTMLGNTLKILKSVPEIDQVLLISRDTAALALGRDFGARTLQEDGTSDLNTALRRATIVAQMYSAQSILVLPADLPLLAKENIQSFICFAGKPPVVVIAPDRRMNGTNALYISPPGLIDYQFGPGSFQRHIQQVAGYKVRVEIYHSQELSLDLDLPEDLNTLHELRVEMVL